MKLFRIVTGWKFWGDEEAAIATEHALLLTLIAVGIIMALNAFSNAVTGSLWAAASALPLGS